MRCLLRLSGGRLNSTIAMISEVRGNRRDFKSRKDLEHLVEGGGGRGTSGDEKANPMRTKMIRHLRDIAEARRNAKKRTSTWGGGKGTVGAKLYSWARPWLKKGSQKDTERMTTLAEEEEELEVWGGSTPTELWWMGVREEYLRRFRDEMGATGTKTTGLTQGLVDLQLEESTSPMQDMGEDDVFGEAEAVVVGTEVEGGNEEAQEMNTLQLVELLVNLQSESGGPKAEESTTLTQDMRCLGLGEKDEGEGGGGG